MSKLCTREGIYKAKPVNWLVKRIEGSSSVAISMRLQIVGWLDEHNAWQPWCDEAGVAFGDEHTIGDFWVVKRDGSIGAEAAKALAESLGWNGSFSFIASNPPPDKVVQVSVKAEQKDGKTYYQACFMKPEHWTPKGPSGADAASAKQLDAQFGSLLRAATSSVRTAPAGRPGSPPPRGAPAQRPAPNSSGPARAAAPVLVDGPAEPLTPRDEEYLANVEAGLGASAPADDEGSGNAFGDDVPWGQPDGATN